MAGAIGGLVLGLGLLGSFVFLRKTRVDAEREKNLILIEGERRYSTLFNTVSDVVYMHDLDGKILEINETISELLGLRVDEIIGRNILDLVGPRHRGAAQAYLQQVSSAEHEVNGVLPIVARTKSRLVMLEFRSTAVIENNNIVRVQGIARNVAEQRTYERSLKRRELQMVRLLEKAEMMRESLSIVTRELLKVQEEERRKISRELHDEIGQLLATMTLNLAMMKKTFVAADMEMLKARITETEKLAGEMFERIRTFLRELRPMALDDGGLVTAIKRLLKDYSEQTGIASLLEDDTKEIESLDHEKKAVIYRMIQEGLTNIAKHAHASIVKIRLESSNGTVSLCVQDDGDGFEISRFPKPWRNGYGLGLLGMQERIHLVRGEFSVESVPGKGTLLHAKIPVDIAK